MEVYIADGVDINAAYVNYIGVSTNGSTWEFIPKEGLSVQQRLINQNTDSPLVRNDRPTQTRIALKKNSVPLFDFDVQDVSSGAATGQHTGWQDGTPVQLQVAVDEIMTWLN